MNKYNQYIVRFINNPPITVWAKGVYIEEKGDIELIRFVEAHKDSEYAYINAKQVLLIQCERSNVELED